MPMCWEHCMLLISKLYTHPDTLLVYFCLSDGKKRNYYVGTEAAALRWFSRISVLFLSFSRRLFLLIKQVKHFFRRQNLFLEQSISRSPIRPNWLCTYIIVSILEIEILLSHSRFWTTVIFQKALFYFLPEHIIFSAGTPTCSSNTYKIFH